MENPEEILHSLEEFSKMKPKDIPRELEEYLMFVAKTGDPIYQWSAIKSLFREKLISVITEFYESCPAMDIPPCPNVDLFNYDLMKSFILEKLEAFSSAPFTLQRICELLTCPRKEYNRIDKFMRAIEKNILVVSTVEPGGRRSNENGDGIMNGIENEPPVPEPGAEINIEEMDDTPSWTQEVSSNHVSFESSNNSEEVSSTNQECVISCTMVENQPYVSIEQLPTEALIKEKAKESLETTGEAESLEETVKESLDATGEVESVDKAQVPVTSSDPKIIQKCEIGDNITSSEPKIIKTCEIGDNITSSEPKITQKCEVDDNIPESTTETKEQEKTENIEIQNKTEAQQEDSKTEVSEDIALEVNEETEKIDESNEVDAAVKEVISEPVTEAAGIENISPETSTESPDTLEASTTVQSEIAEEKVTVSTTDTPKSTENVEIAVENENILKESQDKPAEKSVEEPMATDEDSSESKEVTSTLDKEENLKINILSQEKPVEEAMTTDQDSTESKEDASALDKEAASDLVKEEDPKVNVQPVVPHIPIEESTPNIEKVEEVVPPKVEAMEKIEVESTTVEPMIIPESSEIEKTPIESKVEEVTASKTDSLKVDDPAEEVTEEMNTDSKNTEKTETQKPESEESTPMEVDVTEEKIEELKVEQKEDENLDKAEVTEKETKPDKSDS